MKDEEIRNEKKKKKNCYHEDSNREKDLNK